MLSRFLKILICSVTLGCVLNGCAKLPEQELSDGRQALESADSVAAETWADEEWQEAQDAMAAVEEEVASQEGQLGLKRSYDHTLELLAVAKEKAEKAEQAAVSNKEAAHRQATESLGATRNALTTAEGLLQALPACPKKPKGFDADLEMMRGRLQALGAEIDTIEQLVTAESFAQAASEAEALTGQIEALSKDMLNAMEKIGCPIPTVDGDSDPQAAGQAV